MGIETMTTKFFTTSTTVLSGPIWTGAPGGGVYVAPGVALTDKDSSSTGAPALLNEGGSATAQINGSVTAVGPAIQFGGGTEIIQIGSTGSVISTNPAAGFAIEIDPSVKEAISNAGLIEGAVNGIVSVAPGIITNNGAIYGGNGDAVRNSDGNSTDKVLLYNNGTISGARDGVADTGGHIAYIYNSGAIVGGGGAGYAAAATTETLVNYVTGTLSGGVDLKGVANVTNEGSIAGGTTLESTAAVVNSGTMDQVSFTGAASLCSFTNSGLLTGNLTANGASFTADNSGRIDGGVFFSGDGARLDNPCTMDQVSFTGSAPGASFTNSGLLKGFLLATDSSFVADNSGTIDLGVNLAGDSASLTDSGTIKHGVTLAGSANGASDVRVTSTGVVTNIPGANALEISAGAYSIWTAGEILTSQQGIGVDVHGGGRIVNRGKITGGSCGVFNDAAAGADAFLYNYGSIDAAQGAAAVYDTGGHAAVVHNYGALTGGLGEYAVYADSTTVENLTNAGTIERGVGLDALGSTIVNTGTIDGQVDLLGGGAHFTNNGLVNGDILFGGTGNVYHGALGSVTGTIYGAGADGVYYGGNEVETFDMTASGAKLVAGGAGSDTFKFTAAGLTHATTVTGGAGTGTDTLDFTTAGAITASQLLHVSGIEQIGLADGTNSIALTNALVSTATNASLTVSCGAGADTINAAGITNSAYGLTIDAGQGVDNITAGFGTDTFAYQSGSQSSGPGYDTISGADWDQDKFDLSGSAVNAIDPAVTTGSLSTATFDSDLAAAIGASQLLQNSAVLFTPNAGTLAGHTFLIADTAGAAGYQAGQDLVVDVTGAKGTLSTGNFV
jgi:hypothetical protein